MLWRPFFARVKVNYRRLYSRILAEMCAVAMATGLVKTRLKKGFAHYELTLNPFCQHCFNEILT